MRVPNLEYQMATPIRVAVVDDHAIVREVVTVFIDSQSDLRCVGQAGTQLQALELLSTTRPEVWVIDIELGSDDGITLLRALRELDRHAKVVVLTMHADEHLRREALAAGASAYVLKAQGPATLLTAVRSAGHGTTHPEVDGDGEPPKSQTQPLDLLTPRERQVFGLVARGITHQVIADRIGVTKKSVDTYRTRVYQKLGIRSRAELVEAALRFGVLQPPRRR